VDPNPIMTPWQVDQDNTVEGIGGRACTSRLLTKIARVHSLKKPEGLVRVGAVAEADRVGRLDEADIPEDAASLAVGR
jgi:hypothetical protein